MTQRIRPVHTQVILVVLLVNGGFCSGVNGLSLKNPPIKKHPYTEYPYGRIDHDDGMQGSISHAEIYKSVNYLIDLAEMLVHKMAESGLIGLNQRNLFDTEVTNPMLWNLLPRQEQSPNYPNIDNPESITAASADKTPYFPDISNPGERYRFGPDVNPPPINPEIRTNVNKLPIPTMPQKPFQSSQFNPYSPNSHLPTLLFNPEDEYMYAALLEQMPQNPFAQNPNPLYVDSWEYDLFADNKNLPVNPPPIHPDNTWDMLSLIPQHVGVQSPYNRNDVTKSMSSGRAAGFFWPWHQSPKQKPKNKEKKPDANDQPMVRGDKLPKPF